MEKGRKGGAMKARMVAAVLFLFALAPTAYAVNGTDDQVTNGSMNTYVIFFGLTAEGIQNIKQSPARVQAAKETIRSLGGEVKAFYGILGSEFDTMFILEAPSDKAVAQMALAIGAGGNVRTETHRIFTEDEYRQLISELP
jgi:uncharacterized protein with GYD domain